MENSEFTLKQSRAQKNTTHKPFKKYYDTHGVSYDIEPQKCCAKEVFTENGTHMFYVKMSSGEDIYHPTKNKIEKPMHLRELGKQYWDFKKVKEATFRTYISFLTTGNELFYTNAVRSLI